MYTSMYIGISVYICIWQFVGIPLYTTLCCSPHNSERLTYHFPMHLQGLRDDSLPLSTHSLPAAVSLFLHSWLVRNQLLGHRLHHASKNPKKGFRCNTENEDTKLSTLERTNVNVPQRGNAGPGRCREENHQSCSETSQDKTRTEALRGVRVLTAAQQGCGDCLTTVAFL